MYKQNPNLILVGDLNARHPRWHDVTLNNDGCRLNEWINLTKNLKVYNVPQLTSTRSQAVIDLAIVPFQSSMETTDIDQTMQVVDHYRTHRKLAAVPLINTNSYEVEH